jgi:mevalonate-3-phosphate-5-kinase
MLEYTGFSTDKIVEGICQRSVSLEEIEEKFGKRVKERVETIKTYWEKAERKEVVEPLLIILGGMPGVGKTTTSAKIARTLGIDVVIGGDGFRSVLRALVNKEENPTFFVSVYKAWEVFGEFSEENVIKGFEAQAKILNNAIERLIVDRGIRDGESMTVDFLHFLPSLWYKETLEHPSVMPFLLYVKNEEKWKKFIRNRVKKSHLKGGWERLINALDSYKIMRDYQLRVAREYGIPTIATDEPDAFEKILDIIVERIKKLIEIGKYDKEHPMIKHIKRERRETKS